MASLIRREKIWHIQWYENGRKRRKSLKTESVVRARKKQVEFEDQMANGGKPGHRADMGIDAFTKEFEKRIQLSKRPYTIKTVNHEWKTFREWANPAKLSDITPNIIRDYMAHRLDQGYARSTVRSSLLCLSSVFRTAIKELHCWSAENPVRGIELPKADERFPRFLEAAEVESLLRHAEAHSRDMFLVFALGGLCGLRKNEIVSARWGWVDFERGVFRVSQDGEFKTKSKKDRVIPLVDRLRDILTSFRSDNPKEFIVYPEKESKRSQTCYRCDFTAAFKSVSKAAKLEGISPHTLRHSFASLLAINNVSLYKIQNWLGHSSAATTQIYAHLQQNDQDIQKLGL